MINCYSIKTPNVNKEKHGLRKDHIFVSGKLHYLRVGGPRGAETSQRGRDIVRGQEKKFVRITKTLPIIWLTEIQCFLFLSGF